jgi:hypothetical protein
MKFLSLCTILLSTLTAALAAPAGDLAVRGPNPKELKGYDVGYYPDTDWKAVARNGSQFAYILATDSIGELLILLTNVTLSIYMIAESCGQRISLRHSKQIGRVPAMPASSPAHSTSVAHTARQVQLKRIISSIIAVNGVGMARLSQAPSPCVVSKAKDT